jgi:Rrf2 family protein
MLSKSTEYAVRALVYTAWRNGLGERPGYREIAKQIGAPPHFLAKVMQQLSSHSLVWAGRGRGGGFLVMNDQASLYEIIVATEGEHRFRACGMGLPHCSDDRPCPFHSQYAPIRGALKKLALETSIGDLSRALAEGKAVLYWPVDP